MTQESWAGWYRDRRGADAVILTTDGERISLRIRGVDFEGGSFDALVPAGGIPPESGAFALHEGALSDCVLEWDLPLPVINDGKLHQATLGCLLALQRPEPRLGLSLLFGGAVYESGRAERDFAGALATVQGLLPPGVDIGACAACAYSDYFPSGRRVLSGGLGCFRGAKEEYRAASGAEEVTALWERRDGLVQEVWSCQEFERRPEGAGAPGTGHRGPFPLVVR
ncbi:DUF6304 family protein [Streptomyces sp. NPDC050504]|uniref:DUF6304 family protein n=1 Tax=Streptomyces sp. NPDC050504 TaxID=3365618 RepID=UPI00378A0F65